MDGIDNDDYEQDGDFISECERIDDYESDYSEDFTDEDYHGGSFDEPEEFSDDSLVEEEYNIKIF